MKKAKKVLLVVLVMCMIMSLISGCNKNETGTSVDISDMEVITENTMPITTENITLDIWIRNGSQGYASDYEEYVVVKEIEERTGIKLNFIHPVGAAAEQLNIMQASGDLPDIVVYYFTETANEKLVEDGVYLDLTDYIKKFAPNFNKLISENEDFQKQLPNIDDKITYMPSLIDNKEYLGYNGYFIRQDWLDKVGLSVPETIEEWETVLKAFRDNKLGGKDTVPFASMTAGSAQYEIFASGFSLPTTTSLCVDPKTGNVTHAKLLPGYKEYLTTMNRWYEEGLIDTNFLSATDEQLDSMMLNNELGSIYNDNNNSIPMYMLRNPNLKLVAVPYPKDKNGVAYTPTVSVAQTVQGLGAVVSADCKHPVEAVRLLDYFYSEEGSTLLNWGIKGETYEVNEDGEKYFTDYVLNNKDGKSPQEAFASKYFARSGIPGLVQYSAMRGLEANFREDVATQRNQSIQYSIDTDRSILLMGVSLSPDEHDEVSGKLADINSYMNEMHQKFILGKEPLSKFDDFIKTVEKMGIDRVLSVYNSAYERTKK